MDCATNRMTLTLAVAQVNLLPRQSPGEQEVGIDAIYLLLVLGMYFFAFKAPKFLYEESDRNIG